jgi:hypothetical protein
MAKRPDAAVELSTKMTQALEAQRAQGGGAYPTTLARLRELADPAAPDQLLFKASAKPPFAERAVAAKKKSLTAPVALREDLPQFVAGRVVFEFALDALHAAGPAPWPLKKISGRLEKPLRESFEAAVGRQVSEGTLPESVAVVTVRGKPAFYLKSRPPPKPPEVDLAERLVRLLDGQRRLGPEAYPRRLSRLVELAGPEATPKVLQKARKLEPFASGVVPLMKRPKDPLMVLAGDVEQAAGAPGVLTFLLETSRTEAVQAFTVAELKAALVKPAQGPFADWVNRQIAMRSLPTGIGWVAAKRQRLLFRLDDVGGTFSPASVPAAPAIDFGAAFDEAFARLDREAGSHNFVSLVDLRRTVPFDRAVFDERLGQLRRAGRYSLSAAEGRHGLTEEQRAAGITEEGTLLLYVSRR